MGDQETKELLQAMSQKMDVANEKLDRLEATATKSGALAGAVSGGLSGGIVAAAILIARAKLGL